VDRKVQAACRRAVADLGATEAAGPMTSGERRRA
jgi:hypothetical protein